MTDKRHPHTAGPYILNTHELNGQVTGAQIRSLVHSQNYSAWLDQQGKASIGELGNWGTVSFGTFTPQYNSSGAAHGPATLVSIDETMANARHTLTCLNAHYAMVDALHAAKRLFEEGLPKFNWGDSVLDGNAIALLNEVPKMVALALVAAGAPPPKRKRR